ncbi:superoxide dismutase family protein [Luteimonas sp BLCC-B24]|uniref:superoxide dismutase family protein n=1 Tax=Luteimonas sp. BLCC-B24 TaxID=3025317 RepID=UPI00234D3226|nr:superoxide dismutase family protein [Luteimonas sp. BLCC-B24]MDC7806913.1 superoxide dismutase family protein [Luteimonas sp. BLCC-B24]
MTSMPSRLLVPAVLAAALAACGGGSSGGDNAAAEADRAGETATSTPATETPAAAAAGASAMLEPTEGNQTRGELRFAAVGDRIEVTGTISGLPGNSTHGFHVHETGDCSAPDATSAGGHFNPAGTEHGRVGQDAHHAGDSDNITADAEGNATVQGWLEGATVGDGAATDIVGKAVIVHADADDYVTQPTGNAGDRLACGVIAAR